MTRELASVAPLPETARSDTKSERIISGLTFGQLLRMAAKIIEHVALVTERQESAHETTKLLQAAATVKDVAQTLEENSGT